MRQSTGRLSIFACCALLVLCLHVRESAAQTGEGVAGMGTDSPAASVPLHLQSVTSSPGIGIPFDDQPVSLPDEPKFDQALDTVAARLGRGCVTRESYGWHLSPDEQSRADKIFAAAVSNMRVRGYTVTPLDLSAIAPGLTGMTADRPDRNALLLWSGGKSGLVLLDCQTQAQAAAPPSSPSPSSSPAAAAQPPASDSVQTVTPPSVTAVEGQWVGSFRCAHGVVGAKLALQARPDDHLAGLFSFFPTAKNRHVEPGSYRVAGDYDSSTQRALFTAQEWVHHTPQGIAAPMIVTFDFKAHHMSGIFQGITGCTSFEADLKSAEPPSDAQLSPSHRTAQHHRRRHVKKPAAPHAASENPAPAAATPAQ